VKNSVTGLLALSTLNLIAVYAVANDADIQTSKQVNTQVVGHDSLIQHSSQDICISSQYICIGSRGGRESLDNFNN